MELPSLERQVEFFRREFEYRPNLNPFICCTDDFEEELKILKEQTFPELASLCTTRGIYFNAVHLPIDPDFEKTSDILIATALEAITQCSPNFLCLLGEKYGPHREPGSFLFPAPPKKLPLYADGLDRKLYTAALSGWDWVRTENAESSIQEIFIQHAALRPKNKQARFYARAPEHKYHKARHLAGAKKDNFMAQYDAESEHAKECVERLKKKLVNADMHLLFYTMPEELHKLVLADWRIIIDEVAPPLMNLPYIANEKDKICYLEWLEHETYARAKLRNFMLTDDLAATENLLSIFSLKVLEEAGYGIPTLLHKTDSEDSSLDIQIDEAFDHLRHKKSKLKKRFTLTLPGYGSTPNKRILVLVGDRGIGKTSMIADWLRKFRAEHPLLHVFNHYAGPVAHSTDITCLIRRCLCYFSKDFQKNIDNLIPKHYYNYTLEGTTTSTDLKVLGQLFMHSISHHPCVIVIDGIDCLGLSSNLPLSHCRDLRWLVEDIPAHVRFIVTTCRSDLTYELLADRDDTLLIDMPAPTTTPEKMAYMRHQMKPFSQELPSVDLEELLTRGISQNVHFLCIIGQELKQPSVYRQMRSYMERFAQSCSVRDLLIKQLERWVADHSWPSEKVLKMLYNKKSEVLKDTSGWIADMLRLLVMAEVGLSKEELLGSLELMGYSDDTLVTQIELDHWLITSGRFYLYETPAGVLCFLSQNIKELLTNALISPDLPKFKNEPSSHGLGMLPSKRRVEGLKPRRQLDNEIYHRLLAAYFGRQPFNPRVCQELPWQLWGTKDREKLVQCLGEFKVFELMYRDDNMRIQLNHWWQVLETEGYSIIDSYTELLNQARQLNSNVPMLKFTMVHSQRSRLNRLVRPELISSDSQLISKKVSTAPNILFGSDPDNQTSETGSLASSSVLGRSRVPSFAVTDMIYHEETFDPTGISHQTLRGATDSTYAVMPTSSGEEVQKWIAQMFVKLGYKKDALDLLIGLYLRLKDDIPLLPHREILFYEVMEEVANTLLHLDQLDDAVQWYHRTLENMKTVMLDDPKLQARATMTQGRIHTELGISLFVAQNMEYADQMLTKGWHIMERTDNILGQAQVLFGLGVLRADQRRFSESEHYMSQALKGYQLWYGKNHYKVADVLHEYAVLLMTPDYKRSDDVAAEKFFREALDIRTISFGRAHLMVSETLYLLGRLLMRSADPKDKFEGLDILSEALDITTTLSGANHPASHEMSTELKKAQMVVSMEKKRNHGRVARIQWHLGQIRNEAKKKTMKSAQRNRSQVQDMLSHHYHNTIKLQRPLPKSLLVSERAPAAIKAVSMLKQAQRQALVEEEEHEEEERIDLRVASPARVRPRSDKVRTPILPESGLGTLNSTLDSVVPPPPPYMANKRLSMWLETLGKEGEGGSGTASPDSGNMEDDGLKTLRKYSAKQSLVHSLVTAAKPKSFEPPAQPRTPEKPQMKVHNANCKPPKKFQIVTPKAAILSGPYTDLESLLEPKPRPTPGKHVVHKTAWYHVPGRYPTLEQQYPPKRNQKRPLEHAHKSLVEKLKSKSVSSQLQLNTPFSPDRFQASTPYPNDRRQYKEPAPLIR